MSATPKPIDPRTLPLAPVPCSLGTWTHSDVDEHGAAYLITRPDGQVWGIRANGDLSAENIEADIAHPAVPPAQVPAEISRAEFVIALRKVLNLTEGDVFALISAMPPGESQEDARDLWENARVFKRANRFLLALAQIEGVTEAQVDEVFRVGASLDLD